MSSKRIDIPNHAGWSEGVLEDLCSVVSRGTAPVYVEDSEVRAIGQRCVTARGFRPEFARPHSEKAMTNVLRAVVGDVLLNSTGTGTIGRSCVFDDLGTFIVDGHVTVLRAPNYETGVWLDAVLRTPWVQGHLERFCYSGSTNQVELNNTALRESSLSLPDGKERKGIAKTLGAVNAAIKVTESSIEKLKQVKQGLLHDLLTRGIDSNGELRGHFHDVPDLYKNSPLGWIPKSWSIRSLGDAAMSLIDGPFGSKLKTEHYTTEGVRVVRLQNIQRGAYDDSERAFISAKYAASLDRNRVEAGDVLIASLGDDNYPVGRACCYPVDFPYAINKADCFRFRGKRDVINAFIMLFMNGERARVQVRRYEQGVTMKRVNLRNLRQILVSLPDEHEQDAIVDRLRSIDKEIQLRLAETNKRLMQKSGLMDDLLTGRIRVTSLLDN
jgi:type I restriction enzyme S subunit